MPGPTTTLETVCAAIESEMRAHFGESIYHYGLFRPETPTGQVELELIGPALLLEIQDFRAIENDPLGRYGAEHRLALHAYLTSATPDFELQLNVFAHHVASLVFPPIPADGDQSARGNLWGLDSAAELPSPPESSPGVLLPGNHGGDSIVIQWSQTFWLDHDVTPFA